MESSSQLVIIICAKSTLLLLLTYNFDLESQFGDPLWIEGTFRVSLYWVSILWISRSSTRNTGDRLLKTGACIETILLVSLGSWLEHLIFSTLYVMESLLVCSSSKSEFNGIDERDGKGFPNSCREHLYGSTVDSLAYLWLHSLCIKEQLYFRFWISGLREIIILCCWTRKGMNGVYRGHWSDRIVRSVYSSALISMACWGKLKHFLIG